MLISGVGKMRRVCMVWPKNHRNRIIHDLDSRASKSNGSDSIQRCIMVESVLNECIMTYLIGRIATLGKFQDLGRASFIGSGLKFNGRRVSLYIFGRRNHSAAF